MQTGKAELSFHSSTTATASQTPSLWAASSPPTYSQRTDMTKKYSHVAEKNKTLAYSFCKWISYNGMATFVNMMNVWETTLN